MGLVDPSGWWASSAALDSTSSGVPRIAFGALGFRSTSGVGESE